MAERPQTVIYNGDKYHRYPESEHRHLRVYYWRHTEYKSPPTPLHRQIWMDNNGEIPDGHVIHHADGDPFNNNISNLECLSVKEHAAEHPEMGGIHSDEHLENMIEGASDWHKSDEGREWHREQYERTKEALHKKRYTHECVVCGEEYKSNRKERTKFCSSKCENKQQYERHKETRECAWCGDDFRVNKYKDTRHCSNSCAQLNRQN